MSSTPTATFPANIFPKTLLGVANFAEYLHVEATGETNNPPPLIPYPATSQSGITDCAATNTSAVFEMYWLHSIGKAKHLTKTG